MTMRYTHIGLEDQARALAALLNLGKHIVSILGVASGLDESSNDADSHEHVADEQNASPRKMMACDTSTQETAEGDGACPSPSEEWRRPRRLETGIETRPPPGTRSCSIDIGFPSSNGHALPDGKVATHGCSASQARISLFRA
jgi:hypothetical protein